MSELAAKIGQLLIVGLEGEVLTQEEQSAIERYGFGGFILFGRNCRGPAQLARLCRSLWQASPAHPPFVAIDQEGGRVHRLPEPFAHFPAAEIIGRSRNPKLAYSSARATATELALVGINLNFAPVLDVNSNPMNPVIGDRAFACSAEEVIRFTQQWISGSQDGGIIPCGKHFPGHGDTDTDSHLGLPIVGRPLEELKTTELRPFVHACRRGIAALMTAHVLFRALDPESPATLSRAIIGKLLRRDLGYDGLVFSDDLEMKAISGHYGPEEAALLALRAGVDVLLYSQELPTAIRVTEALCAQSLFDPALCRRVEESHRRVSGLKRRWLKSFNGVAENEVETRLVQLDHRRPVDEIMAAGKQRNR